MKTNQYAYLGIASDTITADEITSLLGITPDAVAVQGSRRADPAVPASDRWALECRDINASVDELVAGLRQRLAPHADAIRANAQRSDVSITLQVVRYFNHLHGQPGLLGWHLDLEHLQFLVSISAALDVD